MSLLLAFALVAAAVALLVWLAYRAGQSRGVVYVHARCPRRDCPVCSAWSAAQERER